MHRLPPGPGQSLPGHWQGNGVSLLPSGSLGYRPGAAPAGPCGGAQVQQYCLLNMNLVRDSPDVHTPPRKPRSCGGASVRLCGDTCSRDRSGVVGAEEPLGKSLKVASREKVEGAARPLPRSGLGSQVSLARLRAVGEETESNPPVSRPPGQSKAQSAGVARRRPRGRARPASKNHPARQPVNPAVALPPAHPRPPGMPSERRGGRSSWRGRLRGTLSLAAALGASEGVGPAFPPQGKDLRPLLGQGRP